MTNFIAIPFHEPGGNLDLAERYVVTDVFFFFTFIECGSLDTVCLSLFEGKFCLQVNN